MNHLNVRKCALIVVALGSFLIPFMGSSLSIALPLIQTDLNVDVILLGWIPTVFVLANAAFLLPFGRLADIHGRKKIFTYGVVIYTSASFMSAISPSGLFLVMGSFLQGWGCSLMFATGAALLISVYPSDHRGEVLGFYITSVFAGLFLGPLLGGFLAENLGWRSIFFFNIPLGLIILSLILLRLKGEWVGSKDDKFDLKGSAMYVPSIIALLYGVSSFGSDLGKVALLSGMVGLSIFIIQEIKSLNPLIRLRELKRRVSAIPALTIFLINVSITAIWTLLSLYMQDLRSLGPQMTALLLAVEPLMVAILSPPVGRLSDHVDSRIFSVVGMVLTTIGLLILSTLNLDTGLWVIVMGLILVGIGQALFSAPTTNILMSSMRKENYGIASATLSTMIYAGQTFSLGILLYIFATFLGNVQITTANFDLFLLSLKTAFLVFAVLSSAGLLIYLLTCKKSE
ncbi:MAG: putative transporter [Methanobacterium sp. PtaU1.Bin242]|nr:MAG: putative transporter [Methanobacterium sp. PtaU1.Bin242]